MCYPQPGPRCYKHSLEKLNNAHARLIKAREIDATHSTQTSQERLQKARENLAYRQSEYDTTNEGMVELAYAYRSEEDSDSKDRYRKRLTLAKKRREKQDAWAQEYNAQKREKKKTPSKKLKDIEKSIKVVEQEYSTPLYQPEMEKSVHATETAEKINNPEPIEETPSVEETPQKEEQPIVAETPEKEEVTEIEPEEQPQVETTRRVDAIRVKSLDTLDLTAIQKGHRRSLSAAVLIQNDTIEPSLPVRTSLRAWNRTAAQNQLESQEGYHHYPVLYDFRNKQVDSQVVLLPQGRKAWEITHEDGSQMRLMMPLSPNPDTRKKYYEQFGFRESIEKTPGRVGYSPHKNEYVVKPA